MPRTEVAETLYDSYGQRFAVDEVLFESKTEHQHLLIFHNAKFGRVMTLDGVVQTTERDEFYYHEMMAHVPLVAHGSPREVLIVGGGDGGLLREVLKHPTVRRATQVEIDGSVVDMAKQWFPKHSDGAFEDPRLDLVIDDGAAFVERTDRRFDAILVDSTDPIGPGEVLFTEGFHRACHRALTPGGVLVTQNGVPFMQLDEVERSAGSFANIFADWHFYGVAVPTYVGGLMALGWASDDPELRRLPIEEIRRRATPESLGTRYWTPEVHHGAFAMPRFVLDAIDRG